jgi:hypothetical protein
MQCVNKNTKIAKVYHVDNLWIVRNYCSDCSPINKHSVTITDTERIFEVTHIYTYIYIY